MFWPGIDDIISLGVGLPADLAKYGDSLRKMYPSKVGMVKDSPWSKMAEGDQVVQIAVGVLIALSIALTHGN